jgi:5S rRNA maturation endonuclease (ribonuclease M5)
MKRITEEERRRREIYREMEDLASEMNYTVDAVFVEGPHDEKTLRLLGFEKPILKCSKLSHNRLADLAAKRFSNVVILTDFDEEGVLLNKKLSRLLETKRVKADSYYRRKFQRLFEEIRITTIEGIYSLKLEMFPFSFR